MQILKTQMSLQAQAVSLRQETRMQTLEISRAATSSAAPGSVRSASSDPSLKGSSEANALDAERAGIDPRLEVLIRMVEVLTGRPVKLMRAIEIEPRTQLDAYDASGRLPESSQQSRAPVGFSGQQAGSAPAGWGARLESSTERIEMQSIAFAARGQVITTEGRRIDFELRFELSSTLVESQRTQALFGDAARQIDPLTLDFAEAGAALSDLRFAFDLDSDGRDDSIAVPISGRGFLAIDKNGNGRIDNGSELFGPSTGRGFVELAALDDDGNGWIDSGDAAWSQLRAWRPDPTGQNGVLRGLDEVGLGAISTQAVSTPFEVRSTSGAVQGQMQSSSVVLDRSGRVSSISQIDLRV